MISKKEQVNNCFSEKPAWKGLLQEDPLHRINPDLLRRAYFDLNRNSAAGVDEETWIEYGINLLERINDLHGRIQGQPTRIRINV